MIDRPSPKFSAMWYAVLDVVGEDVVEPREGGRVELDDVALAEVGDVVVAPGAREYEGVVALAAGHPVLPGAAIEAIGASIADQRVVARAADEVLDAGEGIAPRIAAGADAGGEVDHDAVLRAGIARGVLAFGTVEGVGARAPFEEVVAAPAPEQVVAGIAEQEVLAAVAIEAVIAVAAREDVVAAAAEEPVVAAAARNRVAAVVADQGVVVGRTGQVARCR